MDILDTQDPGLQTNVQEAKDGQKDLMKSR